MNKAYIEICYTYENHSSFLPPIAIVEVEAEDGELIKNLINKAMDRIKEKYPDKTLYMVDGHYLGDSLEIITL
mgnify:FL=1